MKLVECVPNFSEGRRPEVIGAIRDAVASTPGVLVLDLHSDAVHNRSVITMAGEAQAVAEAAFRGIKQAAASIDMRQHQGEHPRIGATDVVPFVPLTGATMDECIALAEQVGERVGTELEIPVYLYFEAARRPERRWLPNIRKGELEALQAEIGRLPERAPDFGPARVGSAGATAIGARPFLIAFNVNLLTDRLSLARSIAAAVRESSGGLAAVQARGMTTADPGVMQVSTNLLDYRITPLLTLFKRIRELAAQEGVAVASSEVVGLLPTEAVVEVLSASLRLDQFGPSGLLDHRLLSELLKKA